MDRVVAALKAKGIPDGNICVFRLEPREVLPEQGSGREIKMEKELPLSEIVKRTKDHLGVPTLRIALGRGANMGKRKPGVFVVTNGTKIQGPGSNKLLHVLCCAEKQCASSCRSGSNLSHRFSTQQSILRWVFIVSSTEREQT